MRILIITNLFPPHILGGYEILCGQVCRELETKGHEITVLASNHGCKQGANPSSVDGAHRLLRLYETFDRPARLSRRKRRRTSLYNYERTLDFLSRRTFDVAFIWSQLRLTLGSARAVRDAGLPAAYTFNDTHPLSYVGAPFGFTPRTLWRCAADNLFFADVTIRGLRFDHATCISQRLKSDLLVGGLPIPNAQVIYQGIPLERFPLKPDPGHLGSPARILYAGQLHAYKGAHTLIEAISLLAGRIGGAALRLSIAGDGPVPYKKRLRDLADACPSDVSFLGKVPHNEIPSLYREHHVFVFPSEWPEPFGLTHLEAMASGTPVVSTTSGGHGEFLEDGHNCLAFPKADAAALAERLGRLLDDAALARRLAEAGRRVVEQRLNLTRYVAQLETFLAEAARKGETPR